MMTAAIANTNFMRFSQSNKHQKTFRVSPQNIKRIVGRHLSEAFNSEPDNIFDISELLTEIGFLSNIEIEVKAGERIAFDPDIITHDPYEADALRSSIELLQITETSTFDLSFQSNSFSRSISERNRVLFKHANYLKREKLISEYNLVFYHKKRGRQLFNHLSSGEQTLISTLLFIRSNLPELEVIIVDEPENSLHPEWQRRYLEFIHMALGYHDIQIYLATHSPILVSGALSGYGNDVEIIRIEGDEEYLLEISEKTGPESVEKILWEAFETITPVNHFLSIKLSRLLQKVTDGVISPEAAEEEIQKLKKSSYDSKQKKLLNNISENLERFLPNAQHDN